MINITAIETPKGFYLNFDGNKMGYYTDLLIDSEPANHTWKAAWYFSEKAPVKVQTVHPPKITNRRFELKEEFYALDQERFPRVIPYDPDKERPSYDMYSLKTDETDDVVDHEFKLNIIAKVDDFNALVPVQGCNSYLVDEIAYHPVLLPQRPCYMDAEKVYQIIRTKIKNRYDRKYAVITSDYDFVFKVSKLLELPEEESYMPSPMFSKKKPKRVFFRHKEVTVFEMIYRKRNGSLSHDVKDATIISDWSAESHEALVNKIEAYVADLLSQINEPLKYCTKCAGHGVEKVQVTSKVD